MKNQKYVCVEGLGPQLWMAQEFRVTCKLGVANVFYHPGEKWYIQRLKSMLGDSTAWCLTPQTLGCTNHTKVITLHRVSTEPSTMILTSRQGVLSFWSWTLGYPRTKHNLFIFPSLSTKCEDPTFIKCRGFIQCFVSLISHAVTPPWCQPPDTQRLMGIQPWKAV